MNSLTSNNTLRRGMGILAIIAIITITFVFVPQAVAAGKTDRGPSRAHDGQTIDRAPGDHDGVMGTRYRIMADINPNGESGGGDSGRLDHGDIQVPSTDLRMIIFRYFMLRIVMTART